MRNNFTLAFLLLGPLWLAGQQFFQEVNELAFNHPIETSNQLPDLQLPKMKASNTPIIHSINLVDAMVELYGKFECALDITSNYTNPYDYDDILVEAWFNSPSGINKKIDGFFMQNFDLNTRNGTRRALDGGQFKIRFSPDEIGVWSFTVKVTDLTGTTESATQTFTCTSIERPQNKGFVRTDRTNYLHFDNDEQLILIGENIAWQNTNAFNNYQKWLGLLTEQGGNFFRLWHVHWGLGIEWKNGWRNFAGLRRYHQQNCFYQDWLYEYCAENGIYVMLTLQHHGPVSTQVNPNWNDSPYNAANGGPCKTTADFFTNQEAIAHTQNRFRYIMARWGYSKNIMAWELFNEVNWMDNFITHKAKMQDWHEEMASYLKTIDVNQHIVTTSFASENDDPVVWLDENIDITQTHFYINTGNIEKALAGGVRKYLEEYNKPTLNGEFGLGGSANLSNQDSDGIHLHNGLWGALFSGALGTAMSWWWDKYIDPKNLYYHFAGLAAITQQIPFRQADMQPVNAYATGAPGDLNLIPNLDWGVQGDEEIIINSNGTTTPTSPRLGQFLYGSQYNTQFRSPPGFTVHYPEKGYFSVQTGSANGDRPKVTIYLNGNVVLNEPASKEQTYTISVPPGNHVIKVDNLGSDWIAITSYSFTGIGSKVDAYALIAQDRKTATGWVLNNKYNHMSIAADGMPESVQGSHVIIEEFTPGNYNAKWFECLGGHLIAMEPIQVIDNQMRLPVPELFWDLSFIVEPQETVVSTVPKNMVKSTLQSYPNPAVANEMLYLDIPNSEHSKLKVRLHNINGQLLVDEVTNDQQLHIPEHIPTGIYWLLVQGNRRSYSQPISIQNLH